MATLLLGSGCGDGGGSGFAIPPGSECGPREGCWFLCFKEYEANPVYDPGSKAYYPCALYALDAFGNDIGDPIDNASSDTYSVRPYYKMWVGDGVNTDFAYSDNGINWIVPTNIQDIVPGYHAFVLYDSGGFGDPIAGPLYKLWVWDMAQTIRYYYSNNGVDWVADANGDITNALFSGSAPVYSVFILYDGGMYSAWADNNGIYYYTTSNDGMNWNVGVEIVHTHNGEDRFYTNGTLSIVKQSDGSYQMWYSSSLDGFSDVRPQCNKGISYAVSMDGVTWDLIDDIPCMKRTNAILKTTDGVAWRTGDDTTGYTYSPCVIFDEDKFFSDGIFHGEERHYKMWFTGGTSGSTRRIGYLSFNK
jgi:hypothetical protein